MNRMVRMTDAIRKRQTKEYFEVDGIITWLEQLWLPGDRGVMVIPNNENIVQYISLQTEYLGLFQMFKLLLQ
jgi:hypothetical protein